MSRRISFLAEIIVQVNLLSKIPKLSPAQENAFSVIYYSVSQGDLQEYAGNSWCVTGASSSSQCKTRGRSVPSRFSRRNTDSAGCGKNIQGGFEIQGCCNL